MFVMTLTPRAGGAPEDLVPALQESLAEVGLRHGAERTAGQDVIAIADRAEAVLETARRVGEGGEWCLGIGIGSLGPVPPREVRAARGPAADAATAALRAARTTSQIPLAVRAADPRQEATAQDAQAVLRLIGWMIATRNTGQRRVVRALTEHPAGTQRELAEHLGITQQSVSRALKTSGWREEAASHALLVRLLSMIDLTSTA